jgi:hypothetical protein
LWAFVFSYAFMGVSGAQPPTDHGRFAVEIRSTDGLGPSNVTIPDASNYVTSSLFYGSSLHRITNAPAGTDQPSALRLEYKVEGDTVFITATVFYGDFDLQNTPSSLEKLRRQTLATHSGKLNDSVVFPELEQVGLEPVTLRIVTAQSESPYRPLTRSDAPSVQMEYAPFDRTFGTVTLHNLSSKAVNAFRVGSSDETGSGDGMEEDKGGLPMLIAPESSYQIRMGVPHSGRPVKGTFVEDPQPQYVILQSVLFADGSYEGEAQFAAEMAAREFGAKVQRLRINRVAEPILADGSLNDESKIDRIRAAIQQLSTSPDAETVAQFHAQYPAFPEDALTKAESYLGRAMKSENESMDHLIQENEPMFQQNRQRLTLARWWTAITEDH